MFQEMGNVYIWFSSQKLFQDIFSTCFPKATGLDKRRFRFHKISSMPLSLYLCFYANVCVNVMSLSMLMSLSLPVYVYMSIYLFIFVCISVFYVFISVYIYR